MRTIKEYRLSNSTEFKEKLLRWSDRFDEIVWMDSNNYPQKTSNFDQILAIQAFTAIKTVGKRVDDMIVQKEVAMKCAFGENPKRVYKDKDNMSRMATASKLRVLLAKAKEYDEKLNAAVEDHSKTPAFDAKLEAMLPVIRKEIPLKAHAHRADDRSGHEDRDRSDRAHWCGQ